VILYRHENVITPFPLGAVEGKPDIGAGVVEAFWAL